MIEIGRPAPTFALPDQHGTPVELVALRPAPVVLVFFPHAFSDVCTGELRALRDDLSPPHVPADTRVLAVSCDSMYAQRVFADREGLTFPVLSDFWPHGAVADAYGAFDAVRGAAVRATFVIDGSGVVRWSVAHAIAHARDVAEYRRALDELHAA